MVSETSTSSRQQRDGRRGRSRRRSRREQETSDGPQLIERSVKIRRVSKVVKGGRNLSFSAMMVVGDGNGKVGAALGKAASVPDAVRKGRQNAERDMRDIVRRETTIPHEVTAKFGGVKIMLRPAAPGTGVIAGGGARAVIEAVGIEDVLSKTYGSNNAVNTVRATIKALEMLRDPRVEVSRRLSFKQKERETSDSMDQQSEVVTEQPTEDTAEEQTEGVAVEQTSEVVEQQPAESMAQSEGQESQEAPQDGDTASDDSSS